MVNTKPPETKKPAQIEGIAVWYNVPPNSRAQRRGNGELTAAHNRLPLETKVRVTHLANGKSVVVRITDRGITNRRDSIRSEEHTSELQSQSNLVCRLLLEKK